MEDIIASNIKICIKTNNCFHSLFLFLLIEEELFGNLSIFNETCVKWQRKTGRLGVQETYTVSGAVLEMGVSFVLVTSSESAM